MKYQKGFAPLVVILLVVLGMVVIVGGYAIYKDKQQQNKLEAQIQDLQNLPINTNLTPTPVDTNTKPAAPLSIKAYCNVLYNVPEVSDCFPSPNNKWIVYSTKTGLRLIEVTTGKTSILSLAQDDRAILWFSDSQRILGFMGYFNQGGCEGCVTSSRPLKDSRMITIWDTSKTNTTFDVSSKANTNIGVKTPPWSYDMEWIIPDHTAYIYAVDKDGAEGDNYYYTLNLDSKSISGPTKNPKSR